jgi:hypothetical protein
MAVRAYLPVSPDGKPDMDVLEAWSETEKVIEQHPE